jgi:hypothetical protein
MTSPQPSLWWPIVTAFVIWFLHFMVSWAAAEIWPHQWLANAWAWGATAIALLAVGIYGLRVRAQHTCGQLPGWSYRFARGAIVIATAAVMFSALPSIVHLP